MRKTALILSCASLLTGCATAPTHQPVTVTCPRVPSVAWAAPEPDFIDRMQDFLSGRLPEPISYELILPNAAQSTTKP